MGWLSFHRKYRKSLGRAHLPSADRQVREGRGLGTPLAQTHGAGGEARSGPWVPNLIASASLGNLTDTRGSWSVLAQAVSHRVPGGLAPPSGPVEPCTLLHSHGALPVHLGVIPGAGIHAGETDRTACALQGCVRVRTETPGPGHAAPPQLLGVRHTQPDMDR